jgi:hypothetical protein
MIKYVPTVVLLQELLIVFKMVFVIVISHAQMEHFGDLMTKHVLAPAIAPEVLIALQMESASVTSPAKHQVMFGDLTIEHVLPFAIIQEIPIAS